MKWLRCPVCQERFDPQTSPAMPFCSERCRLMDLGRWLNEENSVPLEETAEDDFPASDWEDN